MQSRYSHDCSCEPTILWLRCAAIVDQELGMCSFCRNVNSWLEICYGSIRQRGMRTHLAFSNHRVGYCLRQVDDQVSTDTQPQLLSIKQLKHNQAFLRTLSHSNTSNSAEAYYINFFTYFWTFDVNYVSGLGLRNVNEWCDLHRFVLCTNDPTGKHGILLILICCALL
jgi:hypothetical protein